MLIEKSPTGYGIDYTCECIGNVEVSRPCPEPNSAATPAPRRRRADPVHAPSIAWLARR